MKTDKPPPRIYFPEAIAVHGACALPPGQAHHVAHVLRLKAGEALTLFDGEGVEYHAVISRLTRSAVMLSVGEPRAVDRESPLDVTLAQAISSGERMDYTVQKAVELGVRRIVPLESKRSVVRLDGARADKRVKHWRSIAIAACEQCGRNRIPDIEPIQGFGDWLAGAMAASDKPVRIMLSPAARRALRELAAPSAGVILLAGPEGGLAPEEEGDARRAGFAAARLGPRVLRTETAAVAALAALQTLWGDF